LVSASGHLQHFDSPSGSLHRVHVTPNQLYVCLNCWPVLVLSVKVKFDLEQTTKTQKGSRGIAVLFVEPRRYMGLGGQRHTSDALPPGKTRYPVFRKLGGFQKRSGQVRKISPPPEYDPRTVQPVANRYTDYAVPAPNAIST
jgi:hypothetical protein